MKIIEAFDNGTLKEIQEQDKALIPVISGAPRIPQPDTDYEESEDFDDDGTIPDSAYCRNCSGSGYSEGHCGTCPYCNDGIADPNYW